MDRREASALLLLTITVTVLYNGLLRGYTVAVDYSSAPSYVHIFAPGIVTGVSFSGIGVVNEPGMALIYYLATSLMGYGGTYLTAFSYLIVLAFGTYYLNRRFGGPFWSLIGSLIAVSIIGTLQIASDGPGTIYLYFLPLSLGLYMAWRDTGRWEYLPLLGASLSLAGYYGPPIPVIGITLPFLELGDALKSLRADVRWRALRILSVYGMYGLTHLNLIPVGFSLAHELSGAATSIYNFQSQFSLFVPVGNYSVPAILTFQDTYFTENIVIQTPLLYREALLLLDSAIAVIGILLSVMNRDFDITSLFLAWVALEGFGADYLLIHTLELHLLPILGYVDPYETTTLTSTWLSVVIVYSLSRKGRGIAGSWIKGSMVILASSLLIVSVFPGFLYLQELYGPVNSPPAYSQAYTFLYDHKTEGVFITFPLYSHVGFSFLNLHPRLLGVPIREISYPDNPLLSFLPMPSLSLASGTYPGPLNAYQYLREGDQEAFLNASRTLGLEFIVYYTNGTYQHFTGGKHNDTLEFLERATGFHPLANFSGLVYILGAPYSPPFSVSLTPTSIIVNTTVPGRVVTGIPYSPLYSSQGGKLQEVDGFVSLQGPSLVRINSSLVVFNLTSVLISLILFLYSLTYIFRRMIVVRGKPHGRSLNV